MAKQQDVLAILPAHCEAGRVGQVVRALREEGLAVLVVDDVSTDDTVREAQEAGATVLRLPTNLGYGGALQTGYLYARARGYAAVVQLDADGQHDPAFAQSLLQPVLDGEADVVMGSRFLSEKAYPIPTIRRLGQQIFGWLAQFLTGEPVTDPTTGYQALSAEVVALYCTPLFPDDYPDADMRILLHRLGLRVKEVPVRMYADEGVSMHAGVIKPFYYVYKMALAMFIALFVDLPQRKKP